MWRCPLGARQSLLLWSGARFHASKMGMDGFSNMAFNTAADRQLEDVESAVEQCDSDAVEDVSLSDGVLTIDTSKGSFVLNKQAPNAQLWLSSPISGPHHYNMVGNADSATGTVRWLSDRDGHDLTHLLDKEFLVLLGKPAGIASYQRD